MNETDFQPSPVMIKPALVIDRIWGTTQNKNEKLADWFGHLAELEKRSELPVISYQAIYLSIDQVGMSIFDSARILRGRFPLSPIYLMYEADEPPIAEGELSRMGLHGMIRRANMVTELAKRKARLSRIQPALQSATEKRNTLTSSEPPKLVEGYLPVLLEDILTEELTFFDVYLLLPSGKPIKIFKLNDPFDSTRILKFLEEGTCWVYIQKENLGSCIAYFSELCSQLIDNQSVSAELKLLHIASKMILLPTSGPLAVREMTTALSEAEDVIDLLEAFMKQAKSQPNEWAQAYFKNAALMDHATSVTLLAFFFALAMSIEHSQNLRHLAMTAIFHDLGLMTLPERLRNEDERKMSTYDFAQYRLHAQRSVEILKLIGVTDTAVLQAVSQHHEKRDKSGFPNQSGAGEIHPFAEIVGISDELVKALKLNSNLHCREILQQFRSSMLNRYSVSTIEALDILRLWTILNQ